MVHNFAVHKKTVNRCIASQNEVPTRVSRRTHTDNRMGNFSCVQGSDKRLSWVCHLTPRAILCQRSG